MKRYSIDEEFHGLGVMVGDPSGDYVKQEDAQRLVELNKGLVNALESIIKIAFIPPRDGEEAYKLIRKAKGLNQ